jgi:hypothetical protein
MTDSDGPVEARPGEFDLAEAFRARQQQLESDLGFGRTVVKHPGTLGDATELDWLGMLRDFLPKRYGVTRAFVVDVDGRLSEQLDIVIHDRHYSPLLFEVGGAHFIPAESVYAVFEIKQAINRGHIAYAGDKIASVRRLEPTSVGFPSALGPVERVVPPRILGGLLTLNSGWTPMFGQPLRDALANRTEDQQVDLALALRGGAFEVPAPDQPSELTVCDDPSLALIFFALRLLKRLQAMATVGAMDLDAYTRAVWPAFVGGGTEAKE